MKNQIILKIFQVAIVLLGVSQKANAVKIVPAEDKLNITTDFYSDQTSLMPYKGYQNDMSVSLYAQYSDYQLFPLLRLMLTNYYYLNTLEPVGNTQYTSDRRSAVGVGFDYKLNNYIKFRFIYESIDNKLSNTNYNQESYGLIYNQYLEYEYIEINNYLESFLIPRVSSNKLDTFFKIQALKSYYLTHTASTSNVIYPFVQTKVKVNDDANFGVSGQNGSVGGGYRFYTANEMKDNFTFLVEGHTIFFQSKDFNGDWVQILAALQFWID